MSGELSTILSDLKVNGRTIGDITIHPDGSFEGRISDELIHVLWVTFAAQGLADSMTLQPNLIPAIETRNDT